MPVVTVLTVFFFIMGGTGILPAQPAAISPQDGTRFISVREVIGGPTSGKPYSPAIRTTCYLVDSAGNRTPVSVNLAVSGQIAIDPGSKAEVRTSVAAETEQVLKNIRLWVESAGFSMSDVSKCSVFLADIADYDAMNAVYVTFFPTDPPARECVAVKEIVRGFRVEISCSAQK